ncbi:serine protease inhibitor A3L-like [Dendropsophus ebraccatus]|uniref:serine protease inhibitor A3L-like n=1 Tax=Dendropsophus ebraccatus TaxID=150705 RepID=UPI003831827F
MKLLLFLCMGASLVHLGVQQFSYITSKVPRHLPPVNSNDFALLSVEFDRDALVYTYKELDNPDSKFHSNDGVTIFLSDGRTPGNQNAQVIAADFKDPKTQTKLNDYVAAQTSGKIKNFFPGFKETTDAVVISCADKWKVPISGGRGYSVQLQGNYNVMKEKTLGFTMLEVKRDKYMNVLLILPDVGKENAVSAAANNNNMNKWRKSLTQQPVNVEVPLDTVYACTALTIETVRFDDFEYKSYKYASSMALTIP